MAVVAEIPRGGEEHLAGPEARGERLDKWLAAAERLGSRSRAAAALLRRRVWVDDVEQRLEDGARRLLGGERIRVWLDRPGSATTRGPGPAGGLDLEYEDRDLVVLVKPAGLLTVPQPGEPSLPSMQTRLEARWRSHGGRPALAVHRLDRDTSGLVLFARSRLAQQALRAQFARRTPERVYLAVAYGAPDPDAGTWSTWFRWDAVSRVQRPVLPRTRGAFEAIGRYRTLERLGAVSLLEVTLVTGKRHQIRAQAWLAGHPLVGERIYTGPPVPSPARPIAFHRQALHATRLAFRHPRSGARLRFDAPPPPDLARLLDELRGLA
jgi:23S rRNA pseudouridine1911/1915/1917 synthase